MPSGWVRPAGPCTLRCPVLTARAPALTLPRQAPHPRRGSGAAVPSKSRSDIPHSCRGTEGRLPPQPLSSAGPDLAPETCCSVEPGSDPGPRVGPGPRDGGGAWQHLGVGASSTGFPQAQATPRMAALLRTKTPTPLLGRACPWEWGNMSKPESGLCSGRKGLEAAQS